MDTALCQLFLDVARQGTFAKVARERNTDPSSVSRQIAALEAALGCRLFDRTTRRLSPTEAGTLLLERLPAPLDELDAVFALARDLVEEPQGELRVASSIAFGERWLVPRLEGFRERCPKIRLELLLDDATSDLVADNVDVALRLGDRVSGACVVSRLMATRYRVVASPSHIEGAPPLARPADLVRHRCIVFPFPGYRSRWRLRDRRRRVDDVEIPATMIVSNALAIRRAALDGQGVALLADWLVDEDLASGALIDLFPEHEATAHDFDTAVWVLYPSRDYLPAKTRAFVDYVKGAVA